MAESLSLQVANDESAIAPASEAAESWLSARHVSPEATFLVTLAIEEIVTNCIEYGYDDARRHTIGVALSVADQTLTVVVEDDGHPFNPLGAPPPDLALGLEDRPIGGLGIHLLRTLADAIAYERRDGLNRLTLTKRA